MRSAAGFAPLPPSPKPTPPKHAAELNRNMSSNCSHTPGKPCCHTAAQLAHGSKLPFVIRQIPNAHRLIDQKHQRSRGVHELMNAQHRSSTIATLQHARQIVLPRLSHHAQTAGNQGKSNIFRHELEPLPSLGKHPQRISEHLTVCGSGQRIFLQT